MPNHCGIALGSLCYTRAMLKRLMMTGVVLALCAAPAFAADPIRPNAKLTPGVLMKSLTTGAPVGTKQICVSGYSKGVRLVPSSVKAQAYKEYGLKNVPGHFEVDHLISLELGGANDLKNLWPQTYSGTWNAHIKDRLENVLHTQVCSGKVTLAKAQHDISTDWIAAYKKYIGPNPASGSADRNVDPTK
jgi:hypothetical protein